MIYAILVSAWRSVDTDVAIILIRGAIETKDEGPGFLSRLCHGGCKAQLGCLASGGEYISCQNIIVTHVHTCPCPSNIISEQSISRS
jgi:hypothetical protein